MSTHRRTFDRTLVAKLSDARERLHDLVKRARDERARDEAAGFVWPRDINTQADAEVPRG
jgi:hypothetical protein